jgi:hypothetical protein
MVFLLSCGVSLESHLNSHAVRRLLRDAQVPGVPGIRLCLLLSIYAAIQRGLVHRNNNFKHFFPVPSVIEDGYGGGGHSGVFELPHPAPHRPCLWRQAR